MRDFLLSFGGEKLYWLPLLLFCLLFMLIKLNNIIIFSLVAFFISWIVYPRYIKILKRYKIGQTIREVSVTWDKAPIYTQLHQHKQWTPTMGGFILLIVMALMIALSFWLKDHNFINNALVNRQETYVLLFGFFTMGLLWFVDDFLNVKGHGAVKGLSAKAKLIWMVVIAGLISRWFYSKLGIDYINLRPLAGKVSIGIFYPIITFFVTISIVNAINITDGLDGLAGGLMTMILFVLAVLTFFNGTFIATTVLGIIIATLVAFMFYNIHPAKIFMWDSWAFALGWLLSVLLFMLNMRMGIFIPFIILFGLFIINILSVLLQIIWKKYFKRKLFAVSPLHHLFEHRGIHETTIVMKARFIQGILAAITIIAIFYQLNGTLL